MGILSKLLRKEEQAGKEQRHGRAKRQGPLVHVFVFDSGPVRQEEPKYVTNIVRSLLPEAMAYADVPITFFCDERMPKSIGRGKPPDLDRAMGYTAAWMKMSLKNSELVKGLKAGTEEFSFTWEEYSSDRGNRGILYAFYKLIE
jgi:hypothetical protein